MYAARIDVYSNHFVVRKMNETVYRLVRDFEKPLLQWSFIRKGGRYFREVIHVFDAVDYTNSIFRFHINLLEDFKSRLEKYRISVKIVNRRLYTPDSVDFNLQPHIAPRDYQIKPVEFLSDPANVSSLLSMRTGGGKTVCAFLMMAKLKQRTAIIIRGKYINRWLTALDEYAIREKDDVMVIQGAPALKKMLLLKEEGKLKAKIIIFSNKTLQAWFKLYLRFGRGIKEIGYICTPPKLYEFLGIGIRIIDEVHQDFHFNFMVDLFTHCPKSVSLSATLLSDDHFIEKMHSIMFKPEQKFVDKGQVKYIDAMIWYYRLRSPRAVMTTEWGSTTYSHSAFEKSVMRNPYLLKDYMEFIKKVIDEEFVSNYKQGNKLLVIASTIDFCTRLTKFLKEKYPNFDVRRFVEDDPNENLMEPVIRVSTLQSAGTAVDIPGLFMTLLTQAVDSIVSNLQVLGRTREMKDGQTPRFTWMACEDIQKHMDYSERRKKKMAHLLNSVDHRSWGPLLG
jgi:superfamily II DNA or RNA helicase